MSKQEQNNRYHGKQREYLITLKSTTPCKDCSSIFPHYVMDFDHVRGVKKGNVTTLAAKLGMKKLQEEIDKCDIVCANCHKVRTYNRRISRSVV